MARTAEQYCDIYQTISTKQIDLVVADIMHPRFPITDIGTLSMLHGGEVIDAALESGRLVSPFAPKPVPVSDPAVQRFEQMVKEGFATDPWSLMIQELEAQEPITPQYEQYYQLPGLKLKANTSDYLLYVGTKENCLASASTLNECGLEIICKAYGKPSAKYPQGCWKLMIILHPEEKQDRQTNRVAA